MTQLTPTEQLLLQQIRNQGGDIGTLAGLLLKVANGKEPLA